MDSRWLEIYILCTKFSLSSPPPRLWGQVGNKKDSKGLIGSTDMNNTGI
jgi:hypothetical protein